MQRLFGSGSLATGVLQSEQRLSQEQADAIQARWKAKRTGLTSAHEVIVLDSGASSIELSIPPADAQFLESRRFQIAEIARMFGVPSHMLMDTERSTSWGTGIEQQSIGFVVYTLRPWLTRVEQRVSRLVRPHAAYARYAVEGLLRVTPPSGRRSTRPCGKSASITPTKSVHWRSDPRSMREIPVTGRSTWANSDRPTPSATRRHRMSDLLYRFRGHLRPGSDVHRASLLQTDAQDGVAILRLYDPIDSWGGEWGVSAKEFAKALADMGDVSEIRLHINSPGGEVFEGIAIMNQLRAHSAQWWPSSTDLPLPLHRSSPARPTRP